jgi:hypothetical protein
MPPPQAGAAGGRRTRLRVRLARAGSGAGVRVLSACPLEGTDLLLPGDTCTAPIAGTPSPLETKPPEYPPPPEKAGKSMETIIGFVAGYLVGCQDGPNGVRKLRETAQAIVTSDEFRRLTGEAASLAGSVARRAAAGRSLGSLTGTVTDILVHRGAPSDRDPRAA